MPKSLARIVALLLVSALLADPTTATVLTNPLSPRGWERATQAQAEEGTLSLFSQQAIVARLTAVPFRPNALGPKRLWEITREFIGAVRMPYGMTEHDLAMPIRMDDSNSGESHDGRNRETPAAERAREQDRLKKLETLLRANGIDPAVILNYGVVRVANVAGERAWVLERAFDLAIALATKGIDPESAL